jgi:RimJ/RimL family protein N-acetyltransferase
MTGVYGERVTLVPVPHAVAVAVTSGTGLEHALGPLHAAPGYPHADSADALRPHAEHGGPGPAHGTFLIDVGGIVVGECGWFGPPDDNGDAVIGYGLAPSARGTGIGSEAVALLCGWVEQQDGVRRVVAETLQGNEPSQRLLRRLGFTPDGGDPPYLRFVRDRRHLDRRG